MSARTGFKTSNNYVEAFPADLYERIPKAVWAAIAISMATCGGDHLDNADKAILREWQILHQNGIVPQAPPRNLITDEVMSYENP